MSKTSIVHGPWTDCCIEPCGPKGRQPVQGQCCGRVVSPECQGLRTRNLFLTPGLMMNNGSICWFAVCGISPECQGLCTHNLFLTHSLMMNNGSTCWFAVSSCSLTELACFHLCLQVWDHARRIWQECLAMTDLTWRNHHAARP